MGKRCNIYSCKEIDTSKNRMHMIENNQKGDFPLPSVASVLSHSHNRVYLAHSARPNFCLLQKLQIYQKRQTV